MFVPLRVHSTFSRGLGGATLEELAAWAAGRRTGAMALSDIGNVYGWAKWKRAAAAAGFAPVYGCEVEVEGRPYLFLVRSTPGYANLMEILNRRRIGEAGLLEGLITIFFRHPIRPIRGSGAKLRGMTPRPQSEDVRSDDVPNEWTNGEEGGGPDLPRPGRKAEVRGGGGRRSASAPTGPSSAGPASWPGETACRSSGPTRSSTSARPSGWSCCAPSSARFPIRPSGPGWADARPLRPRPGGPGPAQVRRRRRPKPSTPPGSVAGSVPSPSRVSCRRSRRDIFPAGLREVVLALLHARRDLGWGERERALRELAVIEGSGFAPYFQIVHDVVDFARRNGILHNLKGSGASSYLGWLLGLSHVNPAAFDLYFERFLNAGRPDPPDIDLDFDSRFRDQVLAYVLRTYGAGRTGAAFVCSLKSYGARSALYETARAFGLPPDESRALSKQGALFRRARASAQDARPPAATSRSGAWPPSSTGVYSRGLAPRRRRHPDARPGRPRPPARAVSAKGLAMSHFDRDAVEDLKLIKLDLLSVRGLAAISEAKVAARAWPSIPADEPGRLRPAQAGPDDRLLPGREPGHDEPPPPDEAGEGPGAYPGPGPHPARARPRAG